MNTNARLAACLLIAPMLWSQTADRITSAVNSEVRVAIPNSVSPAVAAATSSTVVDPAFPVQHMILMLRPSAAQQTALDALLSQQQDPTSPNFHKFLTPAQFASSFGISQNDLGKVTAWLAAGGFQVDEVEAGGLAIVFSGNAAQVQAAFATEIRQYVANGEIHHANATAAQIPAALASVVRGLAKLNDFHAKSPSLSLKPLYTLAPSTHYLVPSDYAVIYDINPLLTAGVTGTGERIAVVGRSNVQASDIAAFRLNYGLPASAVVPVFATGSDPGIASNGDQIEAALDVEWAGAAAPNAQIQLVMAASTASTDGVDLAAQYAVNNNVAPILSVSFGSCEAVANNAFYNALWAQAAAQGITVVVSSGDSGAAGCDSSTATTGMQTAVNAVCSSPYSTCVGGTMFNDAANPGQYWLASNNAVMGSAISYIPETVWNESATVAGGSGLAASGGGASTYYVKPYWQVAAGVPADGRRDVPDVALAAAQHDGYSIVYNGATAIVSGTSASAPSFAGIMALVAQKYGPQGNANPVFYTMASHSSQSGKPVFHDVTSGNNSVPGVAGHAAGVGYDLASGLGSVDTAQLVAQWADQAGSFGISAAAASLTLTPAQTSSINITLTDFGAFNSRVTLTSSGLPSGVTAGFSPAAMSASGVSVMTLAATGSAVSGTYPITVTATGNGIVRTATFNLILIVSTNCTLSASPVAVTMMLNSSTSTKVTCGGAQGVFSSSLALAVTGAPTGVTATLLPAQIAAGTGVSTLIITSTNTSTAGSFTLTVTATLPGANPAFSRTLSIPLTINAPSTFNVTPSATTVSIQQGTAGTIVLTSAHSGAFNAAIAFSTSGLPSTLPATLSSISVAAPGDGVITITLQGTSVTPVGTYTMMVLAQGAGLILRIPITVQVTAAPAFSLSASNATLTLRQSTAATVSTATVTFTVGTLTNGFNLPVTFAVSGLPAGVTGVFSSATIAAPGTGSTTLTLTASTTATTGISTFSVTATGGLITRTSNIQLTVTPPPAFTIAASLPTYNMLAGAVLLDTISAKGLYGFTSNLQLTATSSPAGVLTTFVAGTINGLNGTTSLTLQPPATLAAGTYVITVTATEPVSGATQTATISLLIGSLTTALNSPALTIARSASGSTTITTTTVSYTGNIALSVTNLPAGVSCVLNQPNITGSGTSTLTLTVAPTARAGMYTITVRAFSDGIATLLPLTLTIT